MGSTGGNQMKMLMTVYVIMLMMALYVFTAEAQNERITVRPYGRDLPMNDAYTPNVVPNRMNHRGMVVTPITKYEVETRRNRRRHIERVERENRNQLQPMIVCTPLDGGGQTCHSF
jgi:hypothetical protein